MTSIIPQMLRTVNVVDNIKPHIALVPSNIDLINFSLDQEDQGTYETVDSSYLSIRGISRGVEGNVPNFPANTDDPHNQGYIEVDSNDETHFLLKLSEVNASLDFLYVNTSGVISTNHSLDPDQIIGSDPNATDGFERRFIFHSALSLDLNNSGALYFNDPGIYVESRSDFPVEVESKLMPSFSSGGDLSQISISYYAYQNRNDPSLIISNKIENARRITFIDETNPIITITPDTDGVSDYIYIEAGEDYDDSPGESVLLVKGVNFENFTSSRYAYDSTDGVISDDIQVIGIFNNDDNTTVNFNNSLSNYPNSLFENSEDYLDKTLRIDYQVTDSNRNSAQESRFLKIEDNTAPTISLITDANETLLSSNIGLGIEDRKNEILADLQASDYKDIDSNLSVVDARSKWTVEFTPSYPSLTFIP